MYDPVRSHLRRFPHSLLLYATTETAENLWVQEYLLFHSPLRFLTKRGRARTDARSRPYFLVRSLGPARGPIYHETSLRSFLVPGRDVSLPRSYAKCRQDAQWQSHAKRLPGEPLPRL